LCFMVTRKHQTVSLLAFLKNLDTSGAQCADQFPKLQKSFIRDRSSSPMTKWDEFLMAL